MLSQSRFYMRLVPKEFDSIALVDDEEEDTKPGNIPDECINVSQFGPVPQVKMVDETTAERCLSCGRAPGVVSAPGVDRFDLGAKHVLNRLVKLLKKKTGCSQEEAEAIVLKLRADDVEIP